MNIFLIQFTVTVLLCVAVLAYLKPWRMRNTASPVIYTLVGLAYITSYLLMVAAYQSVLTGFSSTWWVVAVWSGVFAPAILVSIWGVLDLKTGRPEAHPKIEHALSVIGSGIGIAFVAYLAFGTTFGKVMRVGRNSLDSIALFFAALFGAGLMYQLFASGVLVITPESELGTAIKKTLPAFQKILFFVLTPMVFLGLGLYFLSQAG